MKKIATAAIACFLLLGLSSWLGSGALGGKPITLDSVPPVVVSTVPAAGADGVDPATDTISVTFSKDMRDKSWSWVYIDKAHFPELAGDPRYKGKRVCEVGVKLEPGKVYAIWINSDKFKNFTDENGAAAVPYLLVFKTADK